MQAAGGNRWILTTGDLADLLEVSAATLTRMVQAGMPRAGKNRYDLREVVAYLRAPPPPDAPPERTTGYMEAQTALAEARRRKVELETERLAGELVELEEVHHLMTGMVQRLAGGLEGAAARIAPELSRELGIDPAVALRLLRDEHRRLRDRLAADLRRFETEYRPVGEGAGAATDG